MELFLSGNIKHVGEVTNLQTKDGRPFPKREIVIATNEQYPEVMVCELANEQATDFKGQVGQPIMVSYHFYARQGSNNRWFNIIRCWRYTLGSMA